MAVTKADVLACLEKVKSPEGVPLTADQGAVGHRRH